MMGKFNIEISCDIIKLGKPKDIASSKFMGLYSGVYVMYDATDVVLYVGKTQDLAQRLAGHRKDSYFYSAMSYIVLHSDLDGYEREVLETYLINELKPRYNKSKTYFRTDDYVDEIEEIDNELCELIYDVEDLARDKDGIKVDDHSMYDSVTADVDKTLIQEEIDGKTERIQSLRRRKHTLTMRTI